MTSIKTAYSGTHFSGIVEETPNDGVGYFYLNTNKYNLTDQFHFPSHTKLYLYSAPHGKPIAILASFTNPNYMALISQGSNISINLSDMTRPFRMSGAFKFYKKRDGYLQIIRANED